MNPEPITLIYAPVSRAHWIFKLRRRLPWKWIMPTLAVMLLVAGGFLTLDYGTTSYSCSNCGTLKTERILALFGTYRRYNERVIEGPVAEFLQLHNGPCATHHWEMADESHRLIGATSREYWRFGFVRIIETFPKEDLERVFAKRTSQDPGFVATLTKAVRLEYDEDLQLSLMDELLNMREIPGQ
jgi:hypothetical protein